MREKQKPLKNFPERKPCPRDTQEHAAFLSWFRMTLHPRYTESIRYGRFGARGSGRGHILRANNQAAIGFPTQGIPNLCYLHPEAHGSWFHLDLRASAIKTWREGGMSDEEFKFHRNCTHRLIYRLAYWRENLPNLLDYLGCAGDIRFVTKLTLLFNYKIPNSNTAPHETPESHPSHPHLPGL